MKEVFEKLEPRLDLEKLGFPKGFWVAEPAGVDLFLSGTGEENFLPNEVASNLKLLEEAAQRRKLSGGIGRIFEQMDDLDLSVDEALKKGLIKSEELAGIYQELTEFIGTDDNHDRIILYLPFQILPDLNAPEKQSAELAASQERFADIYKKAWIRLLFESEVRASFVDGDVLEEGLGEPVRIRKAGHLIPEILKKGLISAEDALEQLELATEDELLQSLAEGLAVAQDEQLISQDNWRKVQAIGKAKPMVVSILEKRVESFPKVLLRPEKMTAGEVFGELVSSLTVNLATIEARNKPGSEETKRITPARVKWIKQVERDQVIDNFASQVASELQNRRLGVKEIELLCQKRGFADGYQLAGLRSFIRAGEKLAGGDPLKAKEFAVTYKSLLKKLWAGGSVGVKDEVVSGLAHWQKLGIIDEEFVNGFGIKIPDLASPFPVDLETLLTTDLKPLTEAARKIKENPDLERYLYPIVLVFGSRLKGHAALAADFDMAVFVKPGIPWEKRKEVMEKLRREIPELKGIERILEFWLEKKDNRFNFRQVPEDSLGAVDVSQVHFILGGVWLGQGEEVSQVYGDLLARYLDLKRFKEQKNQVRMHLLRQMEMDFLQFRLLHKGYHHFYPNRRKEGSEHFDLIDWKSDFWDPGFRRVATLLFLSRVFLPDLDLGQAE